MNTKCRDTVNVDVNVFVFNYFFIFQEMESCNCCSWVCTTVCVALLNVQCKQNSLLMIDTQSLLFSPVGARRVMSYLKFIASLPYLHVVLRLMTGTILLLLYMPSWHEQVQLCSLYHIIGYAGGTPLCISRIVIFITSGWVGVSLASNLLIFICC